MKVNNFLAAILAWAALSSAASAAEAIGGTGIGYSTDPMTMVARLVFQKQDAKPGAAPLVIKSGDNVAPTGQPNQPIIVPATTSMAWCDPAFNPSEQADPADFSKCYGSAASSKWFLIDLSALKKQGLKSVWVSIRVSRVKGDPVKGNLIPALTVWRGQQNAGSMNQWYPQTFQTAPPFWAYSLTPFSDADNPGWASAYDQADKRSAILVGKIALNGGDKDYLTVAIGGDARHLDSAEKHEVDFQLAAAISKKRPAPDSLAPPDAEIDQYGCSVGVTCWHPQMDHCMSVSLCNLPQYKGECLCSN